MQLENQVTEEAKETKPEALLDQDVTTPELEEGKEADAFYAKDKVEEEAAPEKVEAKEEVETKETKEGEADVLEGLMKPLDWVSDENFNSIKEFAKENNLTKEAAEKILGNYEKVVEDYQANAEAKYWDEVGGWVKSLKEDKEFGGENFTESVRLASSVFKKYADPETVQLFNEKGYGNYPGLVKMFAKLGKEMANDRVVTGTPGAEGTLDIADKFYGKNN